MSIQSRRNPVSRWTFNAGGVPGGHGHNYSNDILDGWAAVAPPDGWTAADTERVRAALKA